MHDVSRCLGREPPNSIASAEEAKRGIVWDPDTRPLEPGGPDGCGGQDEDGDLRPVPRGSCENEGDWQGRPLH